jgi:site-specific DNA-methyltransferase (adenine-specific)
VSDWTLHTGDCLDVLPTLEPGSVDVVCADPPYGTTACAWDSVIPLEPLWRELRRVLKRRGTVVLTASQPFTTTLIASNREWFKYTWVWEKEVGTNFFNADYQPLKVHEDVTVFSPAASSYSRRGTMTYNPQMVTRRPTSGGSTKNRGHGYRFHADPKDMRRRKDAETCHPRSVLFFQREMGEHGTQKPAPLMEYLVRTYSNEGDTVLDFCMGSGTTGVACVNAGRRFIGMEKESVYVDIARKRLVEAEGPLFAHAAGGET